MQYNNFSDMEVPFLYLAEAEGFEPSIPVMV